MQSVLPIVFRGIDVIIDADVADAEIHDGFNVLAASSLVAKKSATIFGEIKVWPASVDLLANPVDAGARDQLAGHFGVMPRQDLGVSNAVATEECPAVVDLVVYTGWVLFLCAVASIDQDAESATRGL